MAFVKKTKNKWTSKAQIEQALSDHDVYPEKIEKSKVGNSYLIYNRHNIAHCLSKTNGRIEQVVNHLKQ